MGDLVPKTDSQIAVQGNDFWADMGAEDFAIPSVSIGQGTSSKGEIGKYIFNNGSAQPVLAGVSLLVPSKTRTLFAGKGKPTRCGSDNFHNPSSALGPLPSIPTRPNTESTVARVVPYTFGFTGNFERGELGVAWSLSSLALLLLLLPPCANIAILNYARTVTRQQEFAARHALGGSRARIVCQLFIEALVLSAAAAMVALLILHVVSVVMAGRLQSIPGGPPFWMTFDVSFRTLLFVALLAVAGAIVSGLVPALQATGRLARLGSGALAGRTGLQLGATWTTLVVAQVAFSVGVLPFAAELGWGMLKTGVVQQPLPQGLWRAFS